jgi:hypothetical protein
MLRDPPTNTTLALVHAVDPGASEGGVAYIHCAQPPEELQAVNAIVLGNLALPLDLLSAHRLCSPYLQLFCLATEGTGSAVIKSRRNLARSSQSA